MMHRCRMAQSQAASFQAMLVVFVTATSGGARSNLKGTTATTNSRKCRVGQSKTASFQAMRVVFATTAGGGPQAS